MLFCCLSKSKKICAQRNKNYCIVFVTWFQLLQREQQSRQDYEKSSRDEADRKWATLKKAVEEELHMLKENSSVSIMDIASTCCFDNHDITIDCSSTNFQSCFMLISLINSFILNMIFTWSHKHNVGGYIGITLSVHPSFHMSCKCNSLTDELNLNRLTVLVYFDLCDIFHMHAL